MDNSIFKDALKKTLNNPKQDLLASLAESYMEKNPNVIQNAVGKVSDQVLDKATEGSKFADTMICPSCGSKYDNRLSHCPNCQTPNLNRKADSDAGQQIAKAVNNQPVKFRTTGDVASYVVTAAIGTVTAKVAGTGTFQYAFGALQDRMTGKATHLKITRCNCCATEYDNSLESCPSCAAPNTHALPDHITDEEKKDYTLCGLILGGFVAFVLILLFTFFWYFG